MFTNWLSHGKQAKESQSSHHCEYCNGGVLGNEEASAAVSDECAHALHGLAAFVFDKQLSFEFSGLGEIRRSRKHQVRLGAFVFGIRRRGRYPAAE